MHSEQQLNAHLVVPIALADQVWKLSQHRGLRHMVNHSEEAMACSNLHKWLQYHLRKLPQSTLSKLDSCKVWSLNSSFQLWIQYWPHTSTCGYTIQYSISIKVRLILVRGADSEPLH